MKLSHPFLNNPIEWKDFCINSFVIENSKMLREFSKEILEQERGLPGRFVLSDELDILDISRNAEIVSDTLKIDTGSNKKIITAIIKELSEIAINENYSDVVALYQAINSTISNVIFSSGKDIIFDDINDISQILKLYNVRPDEEGLSLAEKVLLHMELCEKYLNKKLFVFFNLRSYFSRDELNTLFQDIVYRKYNVLLVERYDYTALSLEQKRIIDIDLCEI